jgi:hypothetical protein
MTLNMGDFINKFRSQKVPVAVKKVPDSGGQITEFKSDDINTQSEYDSMKKWKDAHDILPSEYLYAFVAWLTTRDEVLEIGASKDCGVWARAVDTFCQANRLKNPKDHYADHIVYPKEIR